MLKTEDLTPQTIEAEADLLSALAEWRDAGGPIEGVVWAIQQAIDVRVEAALRSALGKRDE